MASVPMPAGPMFSTVPWPLPSPWVLLPDHGWVLEAQAGESLERGRAQVQPLCLREFSGVRRGPFYHGAPAFSGLSNDAQLAPCSSVGWQQPRISVGVWRQHRCCTPAAQGLKLAWWAENLHGHCPSATLGTIKQVLGAK